MQERWVRSLGGEDPLEDEMVTHLSILAWKIPWTEEPGQYSSWDGKESKKTDNAHTKHASSENGSLSFTELRSTTSEIGEGGQQKPGNLELGVRKPDYGCMIMHDIFFFAFLEHSIM